MPININIANTSTPTFLMNVPFYLSADVPNNIWMEELSVEERAVDTQLALSQFHKLYRYLTQSSVVYLLPSQPGLQDQTFVSNLAVVLPHFQENTVVVSRFCSQPRVGEAEVGIEFFRAMNFSVHSVPMQMCLNSLTGENKRSNENDSLVFFEGEADLKYLRDNIYLGGYGMRTTRNTLDWFASEFDMRVVPIRLTDERLFHLDCMVLPISGDTVVICTELLQRETLRQIEKYANVIGISQEEAHSGATNCLVLKNEILYDSDIDTLPKSHDAYPGEVMLNRGIEAICSQLRMEPRKFDLSEFYKSGGGLACMIMHLNYANRTQKPDLGS